LQRAQSKFKKQKTEEKQQEKQSKGVKKLIGLSFEEDDY